MPTVFRFGDKLFVKGPKVRTRFQCKLHGTQHVYLFAALAEVREMSTQ